MEASQKLETYISFCCLMWEVDGCCCREHSHVKVPNAPDPREWQSLPQVRLREVAKPSFGSAMDVMNVWL